MKLRRHDYPEGDEREMDPRETLPRRPSLGRVIATALFFLLVVIGWAVIIAVLVKVL